MFVDLKLSTTKTHVRAYLDPMKTSVSQFSVVGLTKHVLLV